ncbi:hypothetical protein L0P24_14310 [Phocaeicola vulgatus]|uniref:Uncharacterized protein n=1 Tax=Phocaeicola vulgatus TaxID=821 RepID=A0AAW4V397_PHOVU|nr:hypothetical protein [Phocaeicola vulgatus]MBU9915118.1 hypothetical protein [Phocaeicola vulgatus]MBV4405454.1 hypothetical protein [Phocaeicola vulgatus]MCB6275142.1 hypothetical protein [Phocaeicola vulgatus]MCB6279689.1 hypothetical protein [Phocaeicola vulgatus]MCB6291871.1 hypothetical protein [Phocaeicola vulgatus]
MEKMELSEALKANASVQFRTNNYGGFLVFRIKWWNGAWGTWKTVSLT